jgi:four helix bundle protein
MTRTAATFDDQTGGCDGTQGSRFVYRYNHLYDVELLGHGTENSRHQRGIRAREIYNNDFHYIKSHASGGIRTGSTIIHDNTWGGQPGEVPPTKGFPVEERYALTDQVRRSSGSIGANLSEAWQKRRYLAHFVSKLTDADGEQAETQHWLDTALACNYFSEQKSRVLLEKCSRIGQILGTMMAKPEKFCLEKI